MPVVLDVGIPRNTVLRIAIATKTSGRTLSRAIRRPITPVNTSISDKGIRICKTVLAFSIACRECPAQTAVAEATKRAH